MAGTQTCPSFTEVWQVHRHGETVANLSQYRLVLAIDELASFPR
jgi:hypothetical protein